MSDLISRQKAVDAMRRHRALFCKNRIEFMALPKDEKARVDEIDNCISDLVNAPDAEPERRWIPVTEALPEEDIDVLLQFPHTMGVGYQEDGCWNIITCDDLYSGLDEADTKPIAWMPLPEPWKGE